MGLVEDLPGVRVPTDIDGELVFLDWQKIYETERPFQKFVPIGPEAEDQRTTNVVFKTKTLNIRDARAFGASALAGEKTSGTKNPFSLDDHGFTFRHSPAAPGRDDFSSKEAIDQGYLKDCEEVLRREFEDDTVVKICLYDWRLRRSAVRDHLELANPMDWLLPAKEVHVDQSAPAIANQVKRSLPEEAAELLNGKLRVRAVNLWRPLIKVEDYPLVLCDGSTVEKKDLVEADLYTGYYNDSTLYFLDRPAHQWHYLSEQTPEEICLFKLYDSNSSVKAHCCPHTAVKLPHTVPGAKPRESIEVRALVFTQG